MNVDCLRVRWLGERLDYAPVLHAMQTFTQQRCADTPDECWVLSHRPVFTQGLNGQPEHILNPRGVPVIATDRGGQVTYHGPGQVVVYTLIDLKRRAVGVREWVSLLEQSVLDFMASRGVAGQRIEGAPGVYVAGAKIAALGLKVRQGRCYHGVSFNVAMDLTPFSSINPCGFAGLPVTDWQRVSADYSPKRDTLTALGLALAHCLAVRLGVELVSGDESTYREEAQAQDDHD